MLIVLRAIMWTWLVLVLLVVVGVIRRVRRRPTVSVIVVVMRPWWVGGGSILTVRWASVRTLILSLIGWRRTIRVRVVRRWVIVGGTAAISSWIRPASSRRLTIVSVVGWVRRGWWW